MNEYTIKKIKLSNSQDNALKKQLCNVINSARLELKEEQDDKDSFSWYKSKSVSNNCAPRIAEDIMSPAKPPSASKDKYRVDSESISDFHLRLLTGSSPNTVPHMSKDKLKMLIGGSVGKLLKSHKNEKSKPVSIPKPKKVKSFNNENYNTQNFLDVKFGLPLPSRFNQLCKLSSTLDQTINYFKVKNKLLVFEDLKTAIDSSFKV
jgi:hypothetical protein